MSLLGGLDRLLNRGVNTVNNDVVKPIQRNIPAPVRRGIVGVAQAVNPFDAESRGNNLINQANQQYHFTPSFYNTLNHANPIVPTNLQPTNLMGADAAGYNQATDPSVQNAITIQQNPPGISSKSLATSAKNETLLHEGLHSVWQNLSPQQRNSFIKTAQQSLPSSLSDTPTGGNWTEPVRAYLQSDLSHYPGYPKNGISNIQSLSPDIQNEVHSYIPEYYKELNQPMPAPLKQYYSQYYGAPQPAQQNGVLDSLKRLLGHL